MSQARKGEGAIEEFIAGHGPLAAALRELPAFEPPARMGEEFQRMLARVPAGVPAFEPPASLEAAVRGEIERQQATQSTRRDAVLAEVARGVDPATAFGARLSPATQAWVRGRSLTDGVSPAAETNSAGPWTRSHDSAAIRGVNGGQKPAAGRARRWPAAWWRYAGGALAAVLALGIGLRMLLESTPREAPDRAIVESMSRIPQTTKRQESAEPARKREAQEAEARRDTLASRERQERDRSMQDRRASAAAPRPPPAAGSVPRDTAPPAPARAPSAAPAPALAPEREGPAPTAAASASRASPWRLSDDPAVRLAGLATDSRWVLLCHPLEQAAAERWLQRGIDAIAANGTNAPGEGVLRGLVRIETHDGVAAGELRPTRDD